MSQKDHHEGGDKPARVTSPTPTPTPPTTMTLDKIIAKPLSSFATKMSPVKPPLSSPFSPTLSYSSSSSSSSSSAPSPLSSSSSSSTSSSMSTSPLFPLIGTKPKKHQHQHQQQEVAATVVTSEPLAKKRVAASSASYVSPYYAKKALAGIVNEVEVDLISTLIRPPKPIDKVESQVDKEVKSLYPQLHNKPVKINTKNMIGIGELETEMLHHFDQLQQHRLMVASVATPPVFQSTSPKMTASGNNNNASTGTSASPSNSGSSSTSSAVSTPTFSTSTRTISAPPDSASAVHSSIKKPRLLKKDTNTILLKSTSKPIKIPKKLEKVKQKCILYKEPDRNLRGDWTVSDDYLLLLLSQRFKDIQSIYNWSVLQHQQQKEREIEREREKGEEKEKTDMLEKKRKRTTTTKTLDWGDNLVFSRQFTIEEMEKRWGSMLYDEKTSSEAASMMALNPSLCSKPQVFRKEEEDALDNAPFSLDLESFEKFLQDKREHFHASRTTRGLQKQYRDRLLDQDISSNSNYLNYLFKDQRQKIDHHNQMKKESSTIGSNNQQLQLVTSSNVNDGEDEQQQQLQRQNMYNYLFAKKNLNHSVSMTSSSSSSSKMNEKDGDQESGSTVCNGPTPWEHLIKSPPDSKEELQNDLLLNPFQSIPKFMWDDDKDIELNDVKLMIKVEKEYEAEKEKDFKHLACIRGENIRYYMKQKDIIVGRDLSTCNLIDLDLREETEFVNRVSKKQFIVKLKTKTSNFYIHNIGKNSIYVNGKPVSSGAQELLSDLSLIERTEKREQQQQQTPEHNYNNNIIIIIFRIIRRRNKQEEYDMDDNKNKSLNNISNENSKVLVDQIITKASDIDTDAAISMVQLIFSKVSRDIGYLPYYTKIISKLAPLFKLKINLDIGETLIKLYYHEFSQLSQLLQQQQQQQQQQSTLSNNNNNNNTFTSIESAVGTHKSHIINASRFIAECYRYQVLNQQHQQQHQNIQQPMDIDDSFSLNGAGSSDVKLLSTVKQQQQQYNGMLLNNDKPFNHLLRLNLDGVEGGSGGGSGSSLPSGFISPKLPVNRSDMSPPTSSIYAGLTTTSPPQIANKTAPGGSGAMLNNGLLSGVVSNLMFNNSNNINSNVPALLANNPNTTGQGGFSGALTYRESPELKLSGAESDLAVILSMIESRVVAKELQTDWRSKILRRVRDMGALMKKSNKTEILAAIWQNMCDNRDDYNLYLELCLDLIKQEEEIEQQQIEKEQQLQLQKQQLLQNAAAAVTMAMPTHHQHQQHSFSSSHTSSALSSFSLEPPRFELGIDQDHGAEQFKKKPAARRSSMATLQMVQQQQLSKLAIPSQQPLLQPLQPLQPLQQPLQQQQPAINARRSSIAFPSELTRRGSMCEDSPSLCPPAPKLKSTPTLKSVSHHTTPIINNIPPRSTAVPTTTVVPTTTATSSNSNNSNNGGQPNSKKLKSSNLDSFKDVLIISLQDELALKMFIARKSLDIYFDLLKDLYKEFIIEIPLLISCIHLIQQGLYELSEVECETLFSLEEMAQEQLQASKETEERQKKLNLKENQRYEWKTGKWEEKPQDPPPPPTSFYDLKSDVFVL
ncbi:initiation factor eIF-4 gamma middle domain-containing protein [Cavenderia fasciculata]|uniref:Initiation factor eIF-4 gamma middle domain-containing protein n=1 Tax=Cavenderia fasciculata TaxID=261658 RepID=F4QC42_CACFS|nr:initiation factor eIF-4 gamma middle domain-containing protein [Cavenderia fasciculata]EGG13529.1 initiation factor eIF-4 gamma middle domain-containing protein [Cavenderia fasciculata]|eukprot:XP_004350233.1 initiation factor eIF-4 gamma middle domain-containing protein [Cavenderia fasciculata]